MGLIPFILKAFSGTGGKGRKGKRNGVLRDVVVAFEDTVRVHENGGETNSIGSGEYPEVEALKAEIVRLHKGRDVRCSDSAAKLESCRDEKAAPLFNSVPQQWENRTGMGIFRLVPC
nr:hypothetical protein [Tanacetum cinerariifolium]